MKRGLAFEDAQAELASSFMNQVEDKTMLRGIADIVALMRGRKSPTDWLIDQSASTIVPNFLRNPGRNADKHFADTRTERYTKESLVYRFLPKQRIFTNAYLRERSRGETAAR